MNELLKTAVDKQFAIQKATKSNKDKQKATLFPVPLMPAFLIKVL